MAEIKSRYEALAQLHAQKADLIRERDGQKDQLKAKQDQLRSLKRQLEDMELEIKDFLDQQGERRIMLDALITAVQEGIDKFTTLSQQTK